MFYLQPLLDNKYETGTQEFRRTISPLYTETKSFLHLEPIDGIIPCGVSQTVLVNYTLHPADLENGATSVNFYYIVLCKSGILLSGTQAITLKDQSSLKGVLKVPVTFTYLSGTAPKMLGFLILSNRTVAADKIFFQVEICFPNTALLSFERPVSTPKADIGLLVTSTVGSICALRVVDKSVQISFEDKELTKEMVHLCQVYGL
ncbi:alpha-2-macroglobulin-like protein 1 [Pyxicephalus adspersus]|uniref:alpha-2-macroglobulin-like protein 1 n=1 Tax=Pyxicephalus adspersus TaxID=30357 RepID=UPI003B5CCFE1